MSKKKAGMLRHIHVEPMTDGSASVKAHNKAPSGGGNIPMGDYESNDESASGATPEEAGAHVTRMLKQHFGKSDGDGDDKYAKHPAKSAFGR
jgi:hypothetical protein